MALPPLKVQLLGDTEQFDAAMGRARTGARRAGLAITGALAGVGVALTGLTRQGLSFVDSQVKMARSLDGTADGLRAVQIAGEDAGVEVQSMGRDLQTMSRELARAADEGGPAADALEKLGLNASDLLDMDVDDRLAAISDRMRQLGISGGQAQRVLQQFGIRNRDFALLLQEGGEAIRGARQEVDEFGLSISEELGEQVEVANDSMTRIGRVFESLQIQLAGAVAPTLERVSGRFADLSREGGPLSQAVSRVAEAFGNLADTLLSEEAIDAAATALSGLLSFMEGATNTVVFFVENIELMTAAFGAAAVAIAALGGPVTLLVGALGGAALGLATIRARAGEATGPMADYETAVDEAEKAQLALNSALGTFSETAAPDSAREAVNAANSYREQAAAARDAAASELARAEAMAAAAGRGGMAGPGAQGQAQADAALAEAEARLASAKQLLEEANVAADRAARQITGQGEFEEPSGGGAPSGGGGIPDDDDDQGGGSGDIAPGVAGADKLDGQLQARLEMLQQGLMTEREAAEASYEEGLEVLRDAREAELITEEEYREAKERLEEEHQERMAKLRDMERRAAIQGFQGMFGDLSTLMRTENEKLFKIGQAAAIANATISGYEAATDAWAKGMKIGGPPVAAAFTAASLARTGALISGIASQSPRGSGGGGGAAGGGGGGAAGTGDAPSALNVQATFRGDFFTQDQVQAGITDLFENLEGEAQRRGLRLTVTA